MDDAGFRTLVKTDLYQVFLFTCPASLPISFAAHPWFVVNKKGALSRWEIFWKQEKEWRARWGYLHGDFYPPFQGIPIFYPSERFHWQRLHLRGMVEGSEGSDAQRMADLIEASPQNYPYRDEYSFFGPNSNTYAQWAIDHSPGCGLELPWNAFGKGYNGHST